MQKIVITQDFHVFVAVAPDRPERKTPFMASMVVDVTEIPEGHTAEEWVAKGLAKAA